MTAYNIVRCKVKPGKEDELVRHYQEARPDIAGIRKVALIKTGERTYCVVGEWDNMESIVRARPILAERLNGMRDLLEDLGDELGVTDPVSGEAVVEHVNL